MAKNLKIREKAFIPKSKIGIRNVEDSAFIEREITGVDSNGGRMVRVNHQDKNGNDVSVAASAIHRNIGFIIIRIGDFETEATFSIRLPVR